MVVNKCQNCKDREDWDFLDDAMNFNEETAEKITDGVEIIINLALELFANFKATVYAVETEAEIVSEFQELQGMVKRNWIQQNELIMQFQHMYQYVVDTQGELAVDEAVEGMRKFADWKEGGKQKEISMREGMQKFLHFIHMYLPRVHRHIYPNTNRPEAVAFSNTPTPAEDHLRPPGMASEVYFFIQPVEEKFGKQNVRALRDAKL